MASPKKEKSTVPVWRYYLSLFIVAALVWIAGYFHGKNAEQANEATATIASQEKTLEIHTEVYSGLPRSRDDSIKWLYKHSN